MGPGDHHCHEGQARICLERTRDRHDLVFVQEKLDGSCVAAAKVGGEILALNRAGWLAESSPYEQHHLWAYWVRENRERFDAVLEEGERLVGEWLAMAHGTRYELPHEPFVAFDLMREDERTPYAEFEARIGEVFVIPRLLSWNRGPVSLEHVQALLTTSGHGAIDPAEGAVWRVERTDPRTQKHRVDFLAKWVRPDKVDGRYLPEVSGQEPVWLWRPETRENEGGAL
jgi:hypothetical protein